MLPKLSNNIQRFVTSYFFLLDCNVEVSLLNRHIQSLNDLLFKHQKRKKEVEDVILNFWPWLFCLFFLNKMFPESLVDEIILFFLCVTAVWWGFGRWNTWLTRALSFAEFLFTFITDSANRKCDYFEIQGINLFGVLPVNCS